MTDYIIEHQEEESLFYVLLDDDQRAYLKYRRSGNESAVAQLDVWSTFVPESHRGQGLAAKLVKHSFDWADSEGLFLTASCWYASKLLARRQQIQE